MHREGVSNGALIALFFAGILIGAGGLYLASSLLVSPCFGCPAQVLPTITVTTTSEKAITSTTTLVQTTTSVQRVTTFVTSTGATVFVTNVSFPHSGTNGTMTVSNIGTKDQRISGVGLNYSSQVCTRSYASGPMIQTGSSASLTVTYLARGQPCGVQANQGSAFSGFVLLADGNTIPFSGVFA